MLIEKIFNFLPILFCLLEFYFLLKMYTYSKTDVFEYELKPNEKEKFFIDDYIKEKNDIINDSKCMLYQELIMDKNTKKLGDVFNLNLELIHSRSVVLLTLVVVYIVFYIILILISMIIIFTPSMLNCCSVIIAAISFNFAILGGVNFIFLIVFLYAFYKGDINAYIDFLNCPYVNPLEFRRYRNIEIFKSNYKGYITIVIINFIFVCVNEYRKEIVKELNNEQRQNQ